MRKKGLLAWLGRRRAGDEPAVPDRLASLLRECGLSETTIAGAARSRYLLRTRVLSTLVENGELTESRALGLLVRFHATPGLALRRSVVDLRLACLPEALALERRVLSVHRQPDGIVVATADPLSSEHQREIEELVGGPVLPHLALHLDLTRAIRAVYQLLRDRPEAAYLIGDDIEVDDGLEPRSRYVPVMQSTEGDSVASGARG